ncbi:ScbR family autoregulator-binding transcription factor [Streptomyces avermitilis]|uniref:ScbR family autoregulator-binding transcription factor n=1 Tax=Streptomyces avermitilis TaxID=33903 RepID=UPI0033B91458
MTKQERAARTRHTLIRSAAHAFERQGYTQATLADISACAGVSPGALHFHFESKAEVARAVEAAAGVSLRRAAWLAQPPGTNALQRLTNTSHALAERLRGDVVTRAGFRLNSESAGGGTLNLLREWQTCVEQLLAEAAEEGLLAHRLVRADTVSAVVAATTGFELLGRRDPEWLSRRSLAAFWRVLLPRAATAAALTTVDPDGTCPTRAEVRTPAATAG